MSVSAIGSGSSLLQYLQSIAANQSSSTDTTASPLSAVGQDSDGDNDGSSGSGVQGSGHHHGHGGGGGLSSQLESAISSALQNSNGADPNTVIQNAIQALLTGTGQAADSTGKTPADGATASATDGSGTPPTDSQAAFEALLKSYNVDPQQFKTDLHTAIQASKQTGASLDFSAVFQNFPPGSIVDTTA